MLKVEYIFANKRIVVVMKIVVLKPVVVKNEYNSALDIFNFF